MTLSSVGPAAGQTPQRMSGMAITSFVLSLLGLVTGCLGVGLLFALIGLVLGIIAIVQIGKPGKPTGGKGLAIAGTSISGVVVLMAPLLLGIMLPALGAARRTARMMETNTRARMIHEVMFSDAQSRPATTRGDRPLNTDLPALVRSGLVGVEFTQTPMDSVDGDAPSDFVAMSPDEQEDWVREHADFVIVPGLVDDMDSYRVAVFGKLDRFEGGTTVVYNNGHAEWVTEYDLPGVQQAVEDQTGKTMDDLTREAESGSR